MATNAIVLIVVAAIAALVLAGMVLAVVHKTRPQGRAISGEAIRGQAEEDELRLRRRQALADEYCARAHTAQVEIDIKTVRACRLQQQANVHRTEAATLRDHLNDQLSEQTDRADEFGVAAQTREMPRPVGFTTLQT
jgi:hypothetical protein